MCVLMALLVRSEGYQSKRRACSSACGLTEAVDVLCAASSHASSPSRRMRTTRKGRRRKGNPRVHYFKTIQYLPKLLSGVYLWSLLLKGFLEIVAPGGQLTLTQTSKSQARRTDARMIDRRYHRSLQLFTWGACAAMTTKLVFFTDYSTRRGRTQPHVFTDVRPAITLLLVNLSLPAATNVKAQLSLQHTVRAGARHGVPIPDPSALVFALFACDVYVRPIALQCLGGSNERFYNCGSREQLQQYADRKLDEFFGVDLIAKDTQQPPAAAASKPAATTESSASKK